MSEQKIECPSCFGLFDPPDIAGEEDRFQGVNEEEGVYCPICHARLELYIGAMRLSCQCLGDDDDSDKEYLKRFYSWERDYKRENDIGYNKAEELMKEVDKSIELTKDMIHRRQSRTIIVKHGDGSTLEYNGACVRRIHEYWFAIFTEHHGNHLYHVDDLSYIKMRLADDILFYNEE